MKSFFAFLLLLFTGLFLKGQSYQFTHYNVEEGLAQSQVYSICQDEKGFMWFATYGGGLSSYDGRYFQNFTSAQGLSSNRIWVIAKAKNGVLWLGTDEGLSFYNGIQFKKVEDPQLAAARIYAMSFDKNQNLWLATSGLGIFSYKNGVTKNFREKDGILMDRVYASTCDSAGKMWFGTYGKGIFSFNGENVIDSIRVKDNFNTDNVLSMITSKSGVIYIGTTGGLARFDGKNITTLTGKGAFPPNEVLSLYEDSKNNLWIGTNGNGVYKYDGKNFIQYSFSDGLDNNQIYSIYEDHEGSMWFGTFGGGVSKLSKLTFRYITTREGLQNNSVWTVMRDSKNNLWMGTNGGGISVYDGKLLKHLTVKDGLAHNMIYCIKEDKSGLIWIGTENGISRYDGKKFTNYTLKDGLPHNNVWFIMEDSKGNFWFATTGGISKFDGKKFINYSEKEGLGNYRARFIYEDRKGLIWVGTNGGGVNIFDGQKFTIIDKKSGLPNDIVFNILEDDMGNYWMGTFGGGVVRYTPGKDKPLIKNISVKDGLKSDQIMSLTIDQNNNLWIGTINGLNKLNIEKYNTTGKAEISYYGKEEGFRGVECNQNASWLEKNGSLWFGTLKGAIMYDPSQDRLNKVEPLTHVTNLKLFLNSVNWKQKRITLDTLSGLPLKPEFNYNENHVTFEFAGLSFMVPEKVNYKYRLRGFEDKWSPVTKSTVATYANLNPGKYTFEVLSANNDGIWNKKPSLFSFVINPPFWETYWYYAIQISILVSLISLTFYLNRNKQGSKFATILLFASVFVIFEYMTGLIEPYFDQFVGGASFIKIILNLIVASLLIPLEAWLKFVFTGKKE